jgi:hypothetical protein
MRPLQGVGGSIDWSAKVLKLKKMKKNHRIGLLLNHILG